MLLPTLLQDKELRTIVGRQVGPEPDFEVLDAALESLGQGGGGFMSEQFKLTTLVRCGDGSPRWYQFFVKVVPMTSDYRKKYVLAGGTYDREGHFYLDIDRALAYNEMRSSNIIPRHFLVRRDLLVMEDLFEQQFKMLDCRQPLDYDHCALVMENLAHFHAATLVHEEATGKGYRMNEDPRYELSDKYVVPLEDNDWYPSGFRCIGALLDLLPGYQGKDALLASIRDALPALHQRAVELLSPDDELRNAVCHGDLWSNNLMFRYDGSGKPDALRILDFQFVRYAPVASDIMTFLQLSVDRRFRRDHEGDLLELYHASMVKALRRSGLDGDVFPKDRFLESCERLRPFGQIMAAVYCNIVFMSEDFFSEFMYSEDCERFCHVDRAQEVRHCFLTDDLFRERVTEALEDLIDSCVLPRLSVV